MTYRNYLVTLQRTTIERTEVVARAQSSAEASSLALAKGANANISWLREPGSCGVFMTDIRATPEPEPLPESTPTSMITLAEVLEWLQTGMIDDVHYDKQSVIEAIQETGREADKQFMDMMRKTEGEDIPS